ncbi:MAG: AbrB family transcriptional regulator [Sphaerochaeta sp.]|uniref:AbrB family transcriptional regulator n=1 Tax=Sphaerochaeta sp. TaxID=1972642 RepID=UPI002FC7DB6F
MTVLFLVLLHLIGAAGGLLLKRLRIPAGALIGALIAVMLFNTFSVKTVVYPLNLRIFVQMLSGMVIGKKFSRRDIKTLHTMIIPVVVLIVSLLSINLLFAYLMQRWSHLSFMTSFFACAPGGVSDLALVAADFGAVMEDVALLQLFRLITVILIFPPMIKSLLKIPAPTQQTLYTKNDLSQKNSVHLSDVLLTLLCAVGGGFTFHLFNIPAGPILGAIIAVATLNLVCQKAIFPSSLKTFVQISAGTYIGSRIGGQSALGVQQLILPALILVVELFFMAFFTAFILHAVSGMDWGTALFSATPGGIQEMGLISDELGLETPKIVLMHTFRILAVLGVLPLIAGLFGS